MRKNKRYINITGKTTDNKIVVSGVFKMMSSTTGLPLEMLLYLLDKNNMCVDWLGFYKEAIKEKGKEKTILNRISTAVGDIYGNEYKDKILKRLDFCLNVKN